jgi:hypothetical protein
LKTTIISLLFSGLLAVTLGINESSKGIIEPVKVFAVSFGVSSLAGLAALLRAGKPISWLSVMSSILNSGLMGLCIALLWYTKFQDNVYFLVGVCVLAGLGGATTIDFVMAAIKSGGLSIKIGEKGPEISGNLTPSAKTEVTKSA